MEETHITIGANGNFDDYLAKNVGGGPAGNWPVKKSAQVGDRIVILIPAMHGDLRAHGTIASEPKSGKWGKSPRYFVRVADLHEINPSIPVALIRQHLPDWRWARNARMFTTVPHAFIDDFWRLITHPPIAYDNDQPPKRIDSVVSRIVRDTATSNALKWRYDFKCQVCGISLPYSDGQHYIEVHHLRPLGHPHDGPDSKSNMLVLCPNHHALFDLAVPRFINNRTIEIDRRQFTLTVRHEIEQEHIQYYTKRILPNAG